MLYNSFRIMMSITALMGIFHMIYNNQYEYIFFPLVIVIWGLFSFFDEDDREYLRRNGIDPDEVSWFFPEYTDYEYDKRHHRRTTPARSSYAPNNSWNNDGTTYTPYAQSYSGGATYTRYNNPEYKKIASKIKRSVKITIDKK